MGAEERKCSLMLSACCAPGSARAALSLSVPLGGIERGGRGEWVSWIKATWSQIL